MDSDPTQAQAEDRRAQIQAKLTRIGNLVANLAHPNVLSGMFIESGDHRQNNLEDEAHDLLRELLAELSRLSRELDAQIQESRRLLADRDAFWMRVERLSRVEQALREQFTNLLASATQLVDSHPGRFRYLEYDVRALSASPEAQPEEGR